MTDAKKGSNKGGKVYTRKQLDDGKPAKPYKRTGMTYESVGARRKRTGSKK